LTWLAVAKEATKDQHLYRYLQTKKSRYLFYGIFTVVAENFCAFSPNFHVSLFQLSGKDVMTLIEEDLVSGSLYSIEQTQDRGRAVYASRDIPAGTTVHIASQPFVSVIKEKFKKEVCAWCFKYHHGKNCSVKHSNPLAGVAFCSVECSDAWNGLDYDGKLVEAWASLRTNKARKVGSSS